MCNVDQAQDKKALSKHMEANVKAYKDADLNAKQTMAA